MINILQIVLALGLLNVWLLRSGKATAYRGRNAKNMKEEFRAYGLPVWFMYVTGFLKIMIAVAFIVGIWISALVFPAAVILSALMLGAISMHIKVRDPFKKALPATLMLVMSLAVIFLM